MVNIPKGTKDVLPSQSEKWHYIEKNIRELADLFDMSEIRTPTFEHTELFLRSIGDETDVVSKEMYTFEDKGGRSITLKPEGTAAVARSYIENALDAMSLPLKLYYVTPVFRYEAPPAGSENIISSEQNFTARNPRIWMRRQLTLPLRC